MGDWDILEKTSVDKVADSNVFSAYEKELIEKRQQLQGELLEGRKELTLSSGDDWQIVDRFIPKNDESIS